jgi:hypothetical protein
MKTKTPRRYNAIENDGFYTFEDGTRVETDEIAVYGIENRPFISETDPDSCEIGTMRVQESGSEWRYATEEELEEINGDRLFMTDLVWSIVTDLTTD